MSGIFGIVDAIHRAGSVRAERKPAVLAREMGRVMAHREWFVAESYTDPEDTFALGRIGIGIFNPGPQPVWNADQTIALVLAGEFYAIDGVEKNGSSPADEHLALDLYQKHGLDFPKHIKGAFTAAIFDRSLRRLIIANDRFGMYPLYYGCRDGRLIFAPEMKGVFTDPGFPRQPDQVALAQYLRFQHLLGTRTFFEDLHLIPNASVLVYDQKDGSCRVTPYWTYADIPYRPDLTFDDAVAETGRLLRKAVERMSGDQFRPGVYLSGGLDSRTILGLTSRRPIVSLNYGATGCRDQYYARRIAKTVGSQHLWVDLPDGNWVKENASLHLDLTEGYHSWIHSHGISTLDLARQQMDVNLTGWDGGTVMGHEVSIEPRQLYAVDGNALITLLFTLFNQTFTWPSLLESEESLLLCDPLRRQLQGVAFESFREELQPYLSFRPDIRSELICVDNHTFRLTRNMVMIQRASIDVRFPYFDYDLFEFLFAMPAELRGPRTLFRALIERETPRLARIPYDKDELLPTNNYLLRRSHALGVRARRKFNQAFFPLFPEHQTLYADYENYLRTDLRSWAEDILFSPTLESRGLFSAPFLRTLMARHMSGIEEWTIGKIAPIITYELMLRRFYD